MEEIKKITLKCNQCGPAFLHRDNDYDEVYIVTANKITYKKISYIKPKKDSDVSYKQTCVATGDFRKMMKDLYNYFLKTKEMNYVVIADGPVFLTKIEFENSSVSKDIDLLDWEAKNSDRLYDCLAKYESYNVPIPEFPDIYRVGEK